ncbi:hypothetical protein [Peterkaempfera griseoplana]|uniref:hypothetical protein n=1 Tax=Peterkaempfera griseoplana TaxID=66896 RepID=UPI0006E1F9F5
MDDFDGSIIEGYGPVPHARLDEAGDLHAPLQALVGQKVSRAWAVWINEETERLEWYPVLLEVGGQRTVVWPDENHGLAVTWGPFDPADDPRWLPDNDLTLQWRSDAHPALPEVVGSTVTAVGLTESLLPSREVVDYPRPPLSGWVLSGLVLATGAGRGLWIHIDGENVGLHSGLPPRHPHHRTTWLPMP